MSTDERRARAAYEALRDYNCPQHICGDCEPKYPDCTCKQNAREVLRAIRASDEAAGMVLVNRDMIQQANALLAKIMSAGHNVPGPTPEDIEDTFWRLDNVLAAATESDNG